MRKKQSNLKSFLLFSFILILLITVSQSSPQVQVLSSGNYITYRIQVGSVADDSTKQTLIDRLQKSGYNQITTLTQGTQQIVQVGSYPNLDQAQIALILMQASGYSQSSVVEVQLTPTQASALGFITQTNFYQKALAEVNLTSSLSESQLKQKVTETYGTVSTNITVKSLAELIQR